MALHFVQFVFYDGPRVRYVAYDIDARDQSLVLPPSGAVGWRFADRIRNSKGYTTSSGLSALKNFSPWNYLSTELFSLQQLLEQERERYLNLSIWQRIITLPQHRNNVLALEKMNPELNFKTKDGALIVLKPGDKVI